ncbi:MAG TPA: septation protein SepH [Actinospica sp.]|nr:septation protein SepH [Actinospica sp.]
MTELRVMAVTGDGDRLVLRAPDGQEFFLAIDDRLRAAVRGDRARLGQIEIELDAQLRPRDIQARIRAGQTAEQVADAAGIPLERVRRFEGPVLAERAFMAERAQNTQVRRSGETHGPKLGDVVRERLAARDPDIDSVQWDSWRKDESVWTVRMSFRIGGLPYEATWSFDPPRRLVHPVDDEARLLSSDAAPDTAFPFAARSAAAAVGGGPTGSARSAQVTSLQSWHGRPAAGQGSVTALPVRPNGSRTASAGTATASPDTEGELEVAETPAASGTAAASTATGNGTGGARPAAAAAAAGGTGAGSAYSDALFGPVGPHKERLRGDTDQQAVNDGVSPGRRATVPSWDEIVFGTRRRKAD